MVRIEHGDIEKLKTDIRGIVGIYLDIHIYKLFFFGSRVTGRGDDRSDFDIGIEGPNPVSSDIMGDIKEALEEFPSLYKIDIIDFKRVSPKFREVAMESAEYF